MSVSIRPATPEDVPAIRRVAEAAWWAACGSFLDAGTVERVLAEWYDPDLLAAAIESEEVRLLVAVDGAVIGYASAELTWADEAELYTCYVHPDRWGEGAGTALVEALAEWAEREGADYLVCGAFADNPVAAPFFEALGFERVEIVETEVFGEVHPECVYEREL